jgi:isovaleryl-CoA dehydrogenase
MSTPYPTLKHGLGEEIDMLRETVHQFAQAEIAPRADSIDANNEFPMDLWRKFGDLGLLGMTADPRPSAARDGLSRPLRGDGGDQPRLRLRRPVLRRALQPVRQPDQPNWGTRSRSSEIPAEAVLRRACRLRSPCREPGAGSDVVSMKLRAEKRRPLRAQRQQDVDHQRAGRRHATWSTPRPTRTRVRAASPRS